MPSSNNSQEKENQVSQKERKDRTGNYVFDSSSDQQLGLQKHCVSCYREFTEGKSEYK